ncbi:MAG: S8 family serine peptidase [Candidatus Eisenbacteria sp.]|nr:S8 family serine peptidase [Candidatus Eisenbacteria bacterium]
MSRLLFPPTVFCVLLCSVLSAPADAGLIDLSGYHFETAAGEPCLPDELRRVAPSAGGYGYYIAQADGPVTAAWTRALEEAGAVLHGYVPEFAYLVGMGDVARQRVSALPGTFWVGNYHPAYAISPGLAAQRRGPRVPDIDGADPGEGAARSESAAFGAEAMLPLRVRVFGDLNAEQSAALIEAIEALGAEILGTTDDGFSRRLLLRASLERIDELARIIGVRWIEEVPQYVLHNTTTCWVVQSNTEGATPLWDRGLHGEQQIVTMMDSGLDYNSCWFRDTGGAPPGPTHRKVIDYAVAGDGVAFDGCEDGHGTHVAGTLCGDQSFINPGNLDANGMAYAAWLTVQDIGVDDEDACTSGAVVPPASLVEAFEESHALGARIHTNSWGSVTHAYTGYSVDVDYAMWTHPDFLICFAAGNYGPLLHSVGAPGTAKNCVTVGACLRAPSQDNIAAYSSRGPASVTDTRRKPTVLAPGGGVGNAIISADNDIGNPPVATCQTARSGFYGTSMATPAVAGMAALVRQYFESGFYPGGMYGGDAPLVPSAALVKAILIASARDTGFLNIPNDNEGWGRILVDEALYFAGDTREVFAVDRSPGLLTGQSDAFDIEIESPAEVLTVTLVWTDYPGTEGPGVKLVNDLDLRVTAPDATEYKGNVFSGGSSSADGAYDRLNVEECVRLPNPAPGSYEVTVSGYNVPQGPQPYALVVNGAIADFPPLPPAGQDDVAVDPAALAAPRVTARPTPAPGWVTLHYTVPAGHAGMVVLEILDGSGRLVRRLIEKGQRGGTYTASWDGRDARGARVAEGVYFARLAAGDQKVTGKLVLSH